jgi:hypothetical protein
VKLLLNGSHLEPQAVRPQLYRGMTTWSSGNPNVKSNSPLPSAPNVEVVCDTSLRTTSGVARGCSLIGGTKSLDTQT